MAKRTVLVIAPGRGTYNKEELGYLARHHGDKAAFIATVDAYRMERGEITVSELDGRERYSVADHTRGNDASPLIYACAYGDFLSIDRERFDVVAVTGNSMGWYIALACAGAAGETAALSIINTMGRLMQEAMIGGQLLYPLVDQGWRAIPGREAELLGLIDEIGNTAGNNLYPSIYLGGFLVFGGTAAALDTLEARLAPEQGRFPLRLANHAAFHTPLQSSIAKHARSLLGQELFVAPDLPLIDGRGKIWTRHGSDPAALRDYTLGHQVTAAYDFTRAVQVGVKEFAPDCLIVLGPGTTLGGAVAQSLIATRWQGLTSKQDFLARQAEDPFLLSMGLDDQRAQVVTG